MRAFAQYLQIYGASSTYARWQNYYGGSTVTWDGGEWEFLPFSADGIEAGDLQNEGSLVVVMPSTTKVYDTVLTALRQALTVDLRTYEFDPRSNNTTPQTTQVQIARYTAQVVNARRSIAQIELVLGGTLSPVGAQVPPRKFTSRLVGAPCRLQ
jgi:hypothetical protein